MMAMMYYQVTTSNDLLFLHRHHRHPKTDTAIQPVMIWPTGLLLLLLLLPPLPSWLLELNCKWRRGKGTISSFMWIIVRVGVLISRPFPSTIKNIAFSCSRDVLTSDWTTLSPCSSSHVLLCVLWYDRTVMLYRWNREKTSDKDFATKYGTHCRHTHTHTHTQTHGSKFCFNRNRQSYCGLPC